MSRLNGQTMIVRLLFRTFLLSLSLGAVGCQVGTEPRLRFGSYPTSTVGTTFLGPEDLGHHRYSFGLSEKNGIVYTCKAGHVDIIHVRIAADWTAYLTRRSFECLSKGESECAFHFKPDISKYFVKITYPENWKDLPRKDREEIAAGLSIELGQYLAYNMTTWHEILTWFGYKCIGFFPEFPSAFSWEDSFSNLLGARIAAEALRDTENEYDQAVTLAIDRELKKLDVQSSQTARYAAESVKGKWFSGEVLYGVQMKKRNLDIGLDDGYVTATVIPGLRQCGEVEAQSYPVQNLDSFTKLGFSIKFEIEPQEWEKDRILRIVYPDAGTRKGRVAPDAHFALIMKHIEEEAINKYGFDVGASPDTTLSGKLFAEDIKGKLQVSHETLVLLASRWLEGDISTQPEQSSRNQVGEQVGLVRDFYSPSK